MATGRDDFVIAIRSAFLNKKDKQKFSLLTLIFLSIFVIFVIFAHDEQTMTKFGLSKTFFLKICVFRMIAFMFDYVYQLKFLNCIRDFF